MKKVSLTDQVVTLLMEMIDNGVYQPGDKLPNEAGLIDHFGVSRSTIRGAVKKMEALDYLQIIHGKGTFVKDQKSLPSFIEQKLENIPYQELAEVRSMLEIKIVQLAAQRRTEDDIKNIEFHFANRQEAIRVGDPNEWIKSDLEFHKAVAKAAKNRILEQFYNSFMETKVKNIFEKVYPQILPLNLLSKGHQEIIDCIKSQNFKDAERIIVGMETIDKRLL